MNENNNISFPTSKERGPIQDIDLDRLNETIEYIRPAVQADGGDIKLSKVCLLYTSPSPPDQRGGGMAA